MTRTSLAALVAVAALAAPAIAQNASPAAPAQNATPPGTDIYLLPLPTGLDAAAQAKPEAIANTPGYDNQPSFTADGQAVLFASSRGATQTDIWRFDRATRTARAVRATPDAEYSPLEVGAGGAGGYSVIRVEGDGTQRLWRYDWSGGEPRVLLTDVKPVGYQAWVDEDTVALFILGQPATLQVASLKTGKAELKASGIGRSLHRIPGSRAIGFVHRVSDSEHWVSRLDVDSGKTERLVRLTEANTERDVAFAPDGAVVASAGTKILRWRAGDSGWTEVFDAAKHGLGAVSRMAFSPNGDALAIVVSERR